MTLRVTLRIVLPDLAPTPDTARVLRALAGLAAPALLAAADAGGMGLPSRLLLHAAVNAAQRVPAGAAR
ncbi:hypothetical protein [Actinacidiphila acidipaludis]|uniref:Uncharacterized protein n=1 Tax=Actinacidiphila acidipaludis TaxID=2873382 RepID=A0ABS7QGM1_9ACTN|nr:hypothetical protein [Streptomyces acidipaludis]MBY8882313.1 hypothetical protein [Streptomyces acidipaludis]